MCIVSGDQTQLIRLGGKQLYLVSNLSAHGRFIGLVNIRFGIVHHWPAACPVQMWMPQQFQSAAEDVETPKHWFH